jgi:hypothetical protein
VTTEQMRAWLLDQYPGSIRWAAKVKNFTDKQVFAVYMRLSTKEK